MRKNKSNKNKSKGGWAWGRFILVPALAIASPAIAADPSDQEEAPTQPSASQEQRATAPDNTRRNASEQSTAEDQGRSAEDREMTRNIRREMVQSGELSSTAKNVKVITVDGKVTLRGPVNSEEEKAAIEAIAEKVAGKGKVTDQLETKKR